MNDENPYRFLLIIVAIIQTAISIRYMGKAKAASTIFQHREEGIFLTAAIVLFYLAYGLGVLAYFVNPSWMAWSAVVLPEWVRWVGTVPLLLGAWMLIWGLHHLGKNLTISIETRDGQKLITTGPYGWVRHPLYTGGMIESVGLCLLMANWFVALSAGLFWTMIACRTPMEEKNLVETFGDDYRHYTQKVGRFVPRMH